MNEDRIFNDFLKSKLEEGVEVPRVAALAGPSVISRPFLLAASLAIVCGVFSWQLMTGREAARERRATRAIDFLEICQDQTASAGSLAERLLSWQDAPFNEIID